MRVVCGAVMVACASACASASSFNWTWKNPDAAPVTLSNKKVLAIVQVHDEARRREGEELLAAAITAQGGLGIASYTLFPSSDAQQDEAAAERLARDQGIAGVVIMSLTDRDVPITRTRTGAPTWIDEPYYRHAWAAWGRGWSQLYTTDSIRAGDRVTMETRVYSLEQDKLLWTGTSDMRTTAAIPGLVEDVAAALQNSAVFVR